MTGQIDFKEICERWLKSVDYERSKKTDPFHIMFMANMAAKGDANEKDLAELKGYYNGLSVAREILERVLWYYALEHSNKKECTEWFNSVTENESEQWIEENDNE